MKDANRAQKEATMAVCLLHLLENQRSLNIFEFSNYQSHSE